MAQPGAEGGGCGGLTTGRAGRLAQCPPSCAAHGCPHQQGGLCAVDRLSLWPPSRPRASGSAPPPPPRLLPDSGQAKRPVGPNAILGGDSSFPFLSDFFKILDSLKGYCTKLAQEARCLHTRVSCRDHSRGTTRACHRGKVCSAGRLHGWRCY